ncbi:MAG TPA: FAD-dependent oxidoreductase [Syntrophomonadaceae bacterium]|nr:FAD-dependent oxidoreductase [Syntrophomonadaceae bacterium]HPR93347.1 FAD-dependent oxidoreductase [Syntrophomonadaceae bacterium]
MRQENLVQMINCSICPNMCRFDCPVTTVVKKETVTPSGKMRLAVMLEKGSLQESKELYDYFYQCTGCRSCEHWCPFENLIVPELLRDAKARAVRAGMAPRTVYDIDKQLKKTAVLYPPEQLAPLPLISEDKPEVLFFAGCAYRSHNPAAIEAALKVLQAADVKVTVLDDEKCCGFPAASLELKATSLELMQQLSGKIKAAGAKTLVTSCPECLQSFKTSYPAAGIELDMEIMHFSQYTARLVEEGRLTFNRLQSFMVWHDPCVLVRQAGIYQEPRSVLAAIPDFYLLEPAGAKEETHCCGGGQIYDLIQPENALAIARMRSEQLAIPNAQAIATSCPFCEDMLGRTSHLPVFDLAEILAAALDEASHDAFLRKILTARIKNNPDLQAVKLEVDQGLVTLSGQVDSWEMVVEAGHLAGLYPGIYSVVNQVKVSGQKEKNTPKAKVKAKHQYPPADVVIIGAGIVGSSLARELSRYKLNIVLMEKEADIACGTSKANNAMIHPALFVEPGSLKHKLNLRGNELYTRAAQELDFPLERSGLLGFIGDEKHRPMLEAIKAIAQINQVPGVEILNDEAAVISRNPNIKGAVGGFFSATTAITCPYKATVAYAENAVTNGVRLHLNTRVTGLKTIDGQVTAVITDQGVFPAGYVINAAGVYADEIAEMAGKPEFTIHPRKGEHILFDRKYSNILTGCNADLSQPPDAHTKGGGVILTVDGNLMIGPTAVEVADKEDRSCTREGLDKVMQKFAPFIDHMPKDSVIAYFAGLRAATYTEDFHIKPSRFYKGLINVAGIQSPGLASAPAIAEYVIEILKQEGLKLSVNPDFNPIRRSPPVFKNQTRTGKQKLIAQDKRYGNIICRCEMVTEAEIVNAIHGVIPATTIDAVKRRTRAGMGRCQSGFCLPKVAHIIARELNIPIDQVTKDGSGSPLFYGATGKGGELN